MSTPQQSQPAVGSLRPNLTWLRNTLEWQNTAISSVALATLNLVILCFHLLQCSVLRTVVNVSLIGLIAGLGLGFVTKTPVDTRLEILGKKTADEYATYAYDVVNSTATQMRHIFLWKNPNRSVTVCALLLALSFILKHTSISFIMLTAFNVFLAQRPLKKVYETYMSHHVDQACASLRNTVAKIPKQKKTE